MINRNIKELLADCKECAKYPGCKPERKIKNFAEKDVDWSWYFSNNCFEEKETK